MRTLKRLALPIGIILGLLVLGFGGAYAGGILQVNFGGGAKVDGVIHVIAPDPTADDLVLTVPEITMTAGSADPYTGIIKVKNNSSWNLTFDDLVITFPPDTGSMFLDTDAVFDSVLPASGTQDIPVKVYLNTSIAAGDITYTGILTYAY